MSKVKKTIQDFLKLNRPTGPMPMPYPFIPEKKKVGIPRIKIFEQFDYLKGPTKEATQNMQIEINGFLKHIATSDNLNLVNIQTSYAASEEADFVIIVTVWYEVLEEI